MGLIRNILSQQPRALSILTVILLLWVTGNTAIQYSYSWALDDTTAQEQAIPANSDEEPPSTATTLSSFQEAVIPISKIHILFVCNFFKEWILVETDEFAITQDTSPPSSSRFFLTLFRQIISPNAP